MFPDFLIIGAQKAGTTWLHRNLQAHPEVWMPKEKELHYFDEKIQGDSSLRGRLRGDRAEHVRWRRQVKRQYGRYKKKFDRRDLTWDLRYFLMPPSDKWYASLFEQGRGKVTGEATPDYSVLSREDVGHVHRIMPEAKIIFMMRNPIERLWSQALMGVSLSGAMETATDEDFKRHFYNKRSNLLTDYSRTLGNWSYFFPEDQIFVGFLEDVHFHPDELMDGLHRFLGTDPSKGRRAIKRKIHTRQVEEIPTRLAANLASTQREAVEGLAREFGGYASFWAHCARRLSEAPPKEESLAYPFWESEMWGEWLGETGISEPGVQSGPLSSARVG